MANSPKGIVAQRLEFIKNCNYIVESLKKGCAHAHVLGIDPARGSTGFAYRAGKQIKTGNIVPKTYGFSKAIRIELALRKLLDGRRPLIALEGYAHNAKFGREKAGELGGLIRRVLYYKKRPLVIIAPNTVKSWIKAGKKENIMLEILDKYGVKITNQDAADAFVMQEVAWNMWLMARAVVRSGIDNADGVRLYLKNCDYKDFHQDLDKLLRHQEQTLFRLINSQGPGIQFFLKIKLEDE